MRRPFAPAFLAIVASCSAHTRNGLLANGAECADDAPLPSHTTLTVRLVEPDGRVPKSAEISVEPCCAPARGECRPAPIDADGRAVLEACPDARSHDVIVSVETNPRWYIYTPPRSVRVCARTQEVTIRVDRHPTPPG